jgi:hypothetical protein
MLGVKFLTCIRGCNSREESSEAAAPRIQPVRAGCCPCRSWWTMDLDRLWRQLHRLELSLHRSNSTRPLCVCGWSYYTRVSNLQRVPPRTATATVQRLVIIYVFLFCMKSQINHECKFPLTQWYYLKFS